MKFVAGKPFRRLATGALLIAALLGLAANAATPPVGAGSGNIVRLQIDGAIGPATSAYVEDGLAHAAAQNARLVLLQLDTPGGLDAAMRDIIKAILNSRVPVATWVGPGGSRAASAGTYILYASHIAAMAPATNLGAATPVQIGGGSPATPTPKAPPGEGPGDSEADKSPVDSPDSPGSAMERKAINDAVAYIRGLAELRGRNADWGELAVRDAASLSAEEAVAANVADLLASSAEELMAAIDGRSVRLGEQDVTLTTADVVIEDFEPDWRTRLLATITDPNIAYMLLLVGIYGLIFEGYNPGALVPGIVGAICILLALYAFQVLPINYAGLGLILLGVILIIAEAFVPSFGALGLGGIAAFVFGSIILLDSEIPGFSIDRGLIGSIAAVAGALLLALMYFVVRNLRRPVVSGIEQMLGASGEALEAFEASGQVFVHGERWLAHSNEPVRKGQNVTVTAVNGLELEVVPRAERKE